VSIKFYNEDRSVKKLNRKLIRNWLDYVVSNEQHKLGEIGIIFCSDDYLLKINKEFLNHDYYTDIVTFNYVEGNIISGDIFISLDRIIENAKEYNVEFENELLRIIVHGILHLLGFDDKGEILKNEMTIKENQYLECISKF